MSTVYLTVGVSSSGKSTWARNMAAADSSIVIACRDDIRRMQGFPTLGSREQEQAVTLIQRGIIEAAILSGKDVIVSDTNINKQFRKHLIKFCHEHGADVSLVLFDLSWETLVDRTKGRPVNEQVPEAAMRKQYDSLRSQIDSGALATLHFPVQSYAPYKRVERVGREVVTVDLDGTVANHYGVRSPYDYTKVGLDKPHTDIVNLVKVLSDHYEIIFVSGREDSCRVDTENWIREHIGIEPVLFMRETGDGKPDWQAKNEIYDREIIPHYNIAFSLDDRDQVTRHMRRRGIRVLQVAPGRF